MGWRNEGKAGASGTQLPPLPEPPSHQATEPVQILSDDPAGFWGSMSPTWVTNSDLRKWRDAHEKGGDFLIFSDIKEITPPAPEVFLTP